MHLYLFVLSFSLWLDGEWHRDGSGLDKNSECIRVIHNEWGGHDVTGFYWWKSWGWQGECVHVKNGGDRVSVYMWRMGVTGWVCACKEWGWQGECVHVKNGGDRVRSYFKHVILVWPSASSIRFMLVGDILNIRKYKNKETVAMCLEVNTYIILKNYFRFYVWMGVVYEV